MLATSAISESELRATRLRRRGHDIDDAIYAETRRILSTLADVSPSLRPVATLARGDGTALARLLQG
jgi:hypothetical protein